jgi:2-hydroxy-3-keto-5-methylthiopentenyl-1-phosphate phosphatase
MLILCDFDGTVTSADTNSVIARHFAPDAVRDPSGVLARREATIRDVLTQQYEQVRASLDDVVRVASGIPLRDGFGQLLDAARDEGVEVNLVSSGFRELIEPLLDQAGLRSRVQLLANSIELSDAGGVITWRKLPMCERCGEHCKRHDVEQLRAAAAPGATVVFIGDGFSDRCGAEAADMIFARDALATWLDSIEHPWEPWEDFYDVQSRLGWSEATEGEQ